MSLRKIALLMLIVGFAATVETAWNLRGDVRFGPEGCRVMGGRFYGPSWSYEASAEKALAAAAAPRLEVDNAFGAVRVSAGAPGVVKVKLRKVVYQPTEEKARAFADRIELRLSGDDGRVRVATNRDELGRGESVGFETHLEIEAPAAAVAELRNEHGRVELSGLAAAEIDSSFDGVRVERVAADVKLEARHGNVELEAVGGAVTLEARHGSVSLSDVAGAATLDVEHGDVDARRTGRLEVTLAHGALTAAEVAGELVVRAQHGPVTASDLKQGASVESSFGELRLSRVAGALHARVEHGAIVASDVTGEVDLAASFDGIRLERVAGPVKAQVEHGGLEAKDLAQGARVRAAGSDVVLEGFAGAVEVEVERGSARLVPQVAIANAIVANARHGGITLEVPAGSRFELDAESAHGRVLTELSGLRVEERGRGSRADGRHEGGGASVTLRADDDISLEPREAIASAQLAPPRTAPAAAAPAPQAEATPSPRP